jgi:hypothetical protein
MAALQAAYQREQDLGDTRKPTVYRALTLDANGRSLALDTMASLRQRYMLDFSTNRERTNEFEGLLRALWADAKLSLSEVS